MPDPEATALEVWLRSNGAPALIPRRGMLLAFAGPFLLVGFMLRSLVQTVLRSSAFLGAFTGLYFIVSSSTDATMREHLVSGHEQHVRACLAARHAYWNRLR